MPNENGGGVRAAFTRLPAKGGVKGNFGLVAVIVNSAGNWANNLQAGVPPPESVPAVVHSSLGLENSQYQFSATNAPSNFFFGAQLSVNPFQKSQGVIWRFMFAALDLRELVRQSNVVPVQSQESESKGTGSHERGKPAFVCLTSMHRQAFSPAQNGIYGP
jgi:hypothetical protein